MLKSTAQMETCAKLSVSEIHGVALNGMENGVMNQIFGLKRLQIKLDLSRIRMMVHSGCLMITSKLTLLWFSLQNMLTHMTLAT